eukprot:36485-Chlamydomonas_euryale.AAC.1
MSTLTWSCAASPRGASRRASMGWQSRPLSLAGLRPRASCPRSCARTTRCACMEIWLHYSGLLASWTPWQRSGA